MGKYFGTNGFRGEANETLTVRHAFAIGRFLGWYYKQDHRPKIVIGKDTRRSSYMFEEALSAGLTASGADVYLLHVIPTPGVAYVVRTEEFDCGIMITASHNPYYDNGIKIVNSHGEAMEEEVLRQLERYLDGITPEVPLARGEEIGCTTDYLAGRNRYIGYLIMLATRSFRGRRVGLDCANGSAFMIAKSVFEALGARTYLIHASPDGTNINRDCGSNAIDSLRELVLDEKLDIGFAYDGDADRCIAVDADGSVIDGDRILYICGTYMKERGQLFGDTIVTTVMSNRGLYQALDAAGISYVKTAVGDSNVYENMQKNGHRLGGEQCGHIIFSKYASIGDGILTSLKLMEVMLEKKQSLSELSAAFVQEPQLLLNLPSREKYEAINDADVQVVILAVAQDLAQEGRILVRASGNEPLVRVMVEAATQDRCRQMAERVADVLKEKGYVK